MILEILHKKPGSAESCLKEGALLVHPVTEPKATVVDVFLPGSNEVWHDSQTFAHWEGAGTVKIPAALATTSVFTKAEV